MQPEPTSEESQHSLPRTTLALYALPSAGLTAMHWLVLIYLLKFSTDVLGLSPALVGTLFAAGRIWDAVTDPMVGWASDRTRSRMGRRRPWMLSAALPLAIGFTWLWIPPEGAAPGILAAWLGVGLFVFYSAQTAFAIPHLSLGAELTTNHHERTRISAARVGADIFGMLAGVGGLYALETATDPHATATLVAGGMGCATLLIILYSSLRIREPVENLGRGASHPMKALIDVARNPHALRITAALFLGELGLGSLMVAIPYASEHLMGPPRSSASTLLGFVGPFALSIPVWVYLARRLGKASSWRLAQVVCMLAFLGMWFLNDNLLWLIPLLTAAIGFGQAGMRTLPNSIKADVIDWDEARTGERKEGTYFAAWNLVDKLAGAVSVLIVGFLIQDAEGGVDVQGVRTVVSVLPAGLLALSTVILAGFRLDESEHARVRDQIASGRTVAQAAAS